MLIIWQKTPRPFLIVRNMKAAWIQAKALQLLGTKLSPEAINYDILSEVKIHECLFQRMREHIEAETKWMFEDIFNKEIISFK